MIQFQDRAASAVERIDNPGHDNHKIQPVAARETGMSWPVNFCEWDSQAVAELTLAHVARLWNKRAMKSSMSSRFDAAIRRFDEVNARDPNTEIVEDVAQPRELIYSRWLTDWVLKLCPAAGEGLRLAARCQHLCRWQSPRDSYPMTRAGYLQWRAELKKLHAQKAGEILGEVGYDDETIRRVQELNLKKNFPNDPESRVLEDALCLVFLERQFAELARKTDDEKMINALRKSWKKMTPAAHNHALKLAFGPHERSLIERALAASSVADSP